MATQNAKWNIRNAQPGEAELLSALAVRSKAHWGYDETFMSECIAEISHSERDLTDLERIFRVLVSKEIIIGFYVLCDINKPHLELEALFVEPQYIGKGAGSSLFSDVLKQAKRLSSNSMSVQSDPNAVGFYLAKGMVITGKQESGSIAGRFLPTLTLIF